MSTATITFIDAEDGTVDIKVSFGDSGLNEQSDAHYMAVQALQAVRGNNLSADDEDDDA